MAERKLTFGSELRGARSVITNLNAISRALDVTRIAATKTFQIDQQIQNVSIQMGSTAAETQKMTDSVLGLSNATGLGTDKTTELVTAMASAGMSVNSMDQSLRGGADAFKTLTDGAAENLEMMAELVGRHGISAAAAVKTTRSMENMGESMRDLTNDVTKWQKQYQIPGMIGQIPQAVAFADKAMLRFGKLVVGEGGNIINSTMKMGATFTKVYGVDMAQAIQMAQQNQEHFMSELATASDVYLGLADSFGPLANALFESGMQMDEVQSMMQQGQESPAQFAEKILQMEKQMEQTYGKGSVYVKRFHQNVLRNSSEAVKGMLEHEEMRERALEVERAAAEESEKLGTSKKAFADMTKSLRDVGSTAVNTFKNLAMLGQTIFGLMFAEELTGTFKGLHDSVKAFNQRVRDAAFDMKKWVKDNPEQVKRFQQIGKTLAIVSAAAAGLASTVAAVIIPFTSVKAVLGAIPGAGSGTLKIFGMLRTGAGLLARKLLLPLTVIGAIGAALNDFGAQLRDPSLVGGETFVRGLQSVTTSALDTIDGLLMGIPTKIVKLFFPAMRGKLSDGVKRLFNQLLIKMRAEGGITLSGAFGAMKLWMSDKLDQLWAWMSTRVGGWKESAGEIGANIGRALGQLAQWAWESIRKLPGLLRRGWNMMINWVTGRGGPEFNSSLENIFWSALDLVGKFAKSFAEEFFASMGSSFDEVKATLGFLWTIFENTFDVLSTNVGDYMTEFGLTWKARIYKAMYEPVAAFADVWNSIRDSAAEGMASIATTAMAGAVSTFTGIKTAIVDFKYTLHLIDEDEADRQKQAIQDNERRLIQSVVGTADTIKAKIRGASVDVEAFTDEITATEDALKRFTDAEAAAERQTKLDERVAGRTQAAETRLAEAREATNQLQIRREEERLRKLADAAAAEQARAPVVSQIQQILEVVKGYRKGFVDAGNTGAVRNIDARIYRIEEALEYAQISNDPARLQQYLDYVKQLVGSAVVREATAGAGTEGAYAPSSEAVNSGYASAPERVGAAPAGGGGTTQNVNVDTSGTVRVEAQVGISRESRDVLDANKPQAAAYTVGAQGQVGN